MEGQWQVLFSAKGGCLRRPGKVRRKDEGRGRGMGWGRVRRRKPIPYYTLLSKSRSSAKKGDSSQVEKVGTAVANTSLNARGNAGPVT